MNGLLGMRSIPKHIRNIVYDGYGSDSEQYVARWILKSGLRWQPTREFRVGKYRLDFAWPQQRICIEVDGLYHNTERAILHDAKRDKWLREHLWIVIRVDCESDTFDEQLVNALAALHGLLQCDGLGQELPPHRVR